MKVRAEDFYKETGAILEGFAGELSEAIQKAVRSSANLCRREIRANAPVRAKTGGKYRDSWKTKVLFKGEGGIRVLVYASDGQYRLTHLLEKGHAKRGGGRVSGIPHIFPAAEKAERKLLEEMKRAVSEINAE